MAQVGFDLEIRVEPEGRLFAILKVAAELAMQRRLRQIGDVGRHAGDRQPLARARSLGEVAPAAPFGIGHHRLSPDLVEGDVLRRMARAGGDRQGAEHPVGIGRQPLQDLHPAHRAAGHREQGLDAEMIEQHGLRPHHVANRDHRKIEAVGLSGGRVERGRAGGPHAAAERVGTDDEIAIGVDRRARADHQRPPARLAGHRMIVGRVLVAGQRVADEDGVGAIGVERPVGLIGDLQVIEPPAGIQHQRLIRAEPHDRTGRSIRLIDRYARCPVRLTASRTRLVDDCHGRVQSSRIGPIC